jgi:hypothetical protein
MTQLHTIWEQSDFEVMGKKYFELTEEVAPKRISGNKLAHLIQMAKDRKKRLEREALGLSKRAYRQAVKEKMA